VRALTATGHADRARGRLRARGQRDDDLLDLRDRPQGVEAPLDHRAAGQDDERLGPAGPKAFAPSGSHDERDRLW
jgi:hypothetical protein